MTLDASTRHDLKDAVQLPDKTDLSRGNFHFLRTRPVGNFGLARSSAGRQNCRAAFRKGPRRNQTDIMDRRAKGGSLPSVPRSKGCINCVSRKTRCGMLTIVFSHVLAHQLTWPPC